MLTRIKAVPAQSADGVAFTGVEFSTIRKLKADEILGVMASKKAYEQEFRVGSIEDEESGSDDSTAPDASARADQTQRAKAADVM